MDALPYHEPRIVNILVLSSFLLLLNIVNHILDKILYCGLVGQIFIGMFWGLPLGNWLNEELQHAIVQLGYLGLILLVYEGGLNTSAKSLISNFLLSSLVALTGILDPIALSFILQYLTPATNKQCFQAGVALSATSLGTTFTILSTAGIANTRLGVILTSAAMIDDVVGLVMVKVVSGGSIGRTIGASMGLLVVVVSLCYFVKMPNLTFKREVRFILHSSILIATVVVAAYAGTSVLFAAFLAGAAITWWSRNTEDGKDDAGVKLYDQYCGQIVDKILKPFFFASIGFSIPVKRMFRADIVWKGISYALLMSFAKFITGVWLVRFRVRFLKGHDEVQNIGVVKGTDTSNQAKEATAMNNQEIDTDMITNSVSTEPETPRLDTTTTRREYAGRNASVTNTNVSDNIEKEGTEESEHNNTDQGKYKNLEIAPTDTQEASNEANQSHTVFAPAILGFAMIARGEIAFLIASIAQSHGVFTDDLYLIVVWAALICTIIGPLGAGLLVKRIKKLDGKSKPLGMWT